MNLQTTQSFILSSFQRLVSCEPLTIRTRTRTQICTSNVQLRSWGGEGKGDQTVVISTDMIKDAHCSAPSRSSAARVCKLRRYRVCLAGPVNAWQRPDPPAMRKLKVLHMS